MKKNHVFVFILLTTIMFLSSSIVCTTQAADWSLEVNARSTAYQSFNVDKAKRELTFKIVVRQGGPISFYVLNDSAFNIWGSNGLVTAYTGAYNVSEGQTAYATGRVGDPGTYYAIVDNRNNDNNAIVDITIIQRAPFPSILIIGLSFIPLILLIRKKRTKQSR